MDLIQKIRNMKNKPPSAAVRSVYETEHDGHEFNSEMEEDVEKVNVDYAKKYVRREEVLYASAQQLPATNAMSMVESNSDMVSHAGRSEVNQIRQNQMCDVYDKYTFGKSTCILPIDDYRDRIIQHLDAYDVIVIQGPTGCGKTTHVPQFILDDCKQKNKPCKIAVTQPRRIAAITVARRVCEERSWSLGYVCGYQVGLDRKSSHDTILSFVTTGVLLQKLIKAKSLCEYTHIIVDEVHERNQDMDFLLLIIRKFLNTNSSGVKIILMSATINTNIFSQYFKTFSTSEFSPAAVIQMSQKTHHNVQIFYTNQLGPIGTVNNFDYTHPTIDKDTFHLFVKLIAALDKLDPIESATNTTTIGNVLVFLPGILEIEEAHDQLTTYNQLEQTKRNICPWHIIPLHSSLTIEEQRRVFQPPPQGMRKIILSTNIAESSITVPDILYVVDFCLTKTMIMDPKTQYQSLQLQWASHTHCNQRAGRVGRVADGRVYRLIPEAFYYEEFFEDVAPEILRAPLHSLVLSAKMLQLNEPPKAILALAMDPPNLNNIDKTVLFLKEVGGLALTCRGVKLARDGDITFLGQVMAALPLDVRLSKFIVLGHIFSCLEDCIIMATGCSLSVFKTPFKDRLKSYINSLQWADNSTCDFIAYLNLYKVWQRQKQMNANLREEKDWCTKNYVSSRSLKEWEILVREVKNRLEHMNITPSNDLGRVVLTDTEIPMIIKVVICGAFYPNYFKFPKQEGNSTEREAVKVLNGLDPCNTVYFTGFPDNQPGQLYSKHIKKYFEHCASDIDMKVSFNNSSKVYVQFLNRNQSERVRVGGQHFLKGMPGKVKVEVYRAVLLRKLNIRCSFKIMESNKALALAKKLGIDSNSSLISIASKTNGDSRNAPESHNILATPSLNIECIKITIVERIDASNFWAHNADEDTSSVLEKIGIVLNDDVDKVVAKTIDTSKYYFAKYEFDRLYYRCKVLEYTSNDSHRKIVKVLFIDYGTIAVVSSNLLYELPNHELMEKPPLAFECQLSEVQPSMLYNPQGLWDETVNKVFDNRILNTTFFAKVYSVVNGVACLELYSINEKEFVFANSFNSWLISKGYGQHSEESFLSKENHLKRLDIVGNPEMWNGFAMDDVIAKAVRDVPPPDDCICKNIIELKGPFSPLETNIFSIVGAGFSKNAKIEGSSVNCITLDTNPEDNHERLIVAGSIHQNPDGSSLNLRHTTVMPNIDGFPMLMSLLFCPLVEIKPSADGTRIASILCGLGSQDDYKSLYPSHDISIILDTELSIEDINKINELRYWMSMSIKYLETSYHGGTIPTTMEECQRELKLRLYELLQVQRKAVNRDFIQNASVWGKFLYDADLLQPGNTGIQEEVWPLHSGIKLNNKRHTEYKSHITELENAAMNLQPVTDLTCLFCNVKLISVFDTRVHVTSKQHKDVVLATMGLNNNT